MKKAECQKRCIRGTVVLCVHYDNRYTLGAMRQACKYYGNTFMETKSSSLLFVDDNAE